MLRITHTGKSVNFPVTIGRISITILDRINNKITIASKFNQWNNTASVIMKPVSGLKPLKANNTPVLFALHSTFSQPTTTSPLTKETS